MPCVFVERREYMCVFDRSGEVLPSPVLICKQTDILGDEVAPNPKVYDSMTHFFVAPVAGVLTEGTVRENHVPLPLRQQRKHGRFYILAR